MDIEDDQNMKSDSEVFLDDLDYASLGHEEDEDADKSDDLEIN
jgi:hypothetical protein